MIYEIIKGQGYHKKIPLGNGLQAQVERKNGTQLMVQADYKGV